MEERGSVLTSLGEVDVELDNNSRGGSCSCI